MKLHIKSKGLYFAILSTLAISGAQTASANEEDSQLRDLLAKQQVTSVEVPPAQDPNMVELGRNLFFDKELSGRRNISCSTCHNTLLGSADGQGQSRAQGAIGLGPHRRGDGDERFDFLPRNALSLWNRAVDGWDTMFWDGRLQGTLEGGYTSPAGDDTPQNFTNVLTAFSAFPITPDEEMRGFPGQLDVLGNVNELSDLTDDDFVQIWEFITARVTDNEGYNDLLAKAFPGVPESTLDIVNISEAIGAFMTEAFTALDAPFDRYLAGDDDALSAKQKRGATLFYGNANCANCHSGGLQTDLDFHSIAAPQVGTGRGDSAPLDLGRGAITGNTQDNFKFRTPSLRNIELEGPYMHNGAFTELRDAVVHHTNPLVSLQNYDVSQIEPELNGAFQNDPETINALINSIDQSVLKPRFRLSNNDIDDIMAFLSSLTDPASLNMSEVIPSSVPSGLPLND